MTSLLKSATIQLVMDDQEDKFYTDYLGGVHSAKNSQELAQRYDFGANNYDAQIAKSGYIKKIPMLVIGLACRYIKPGDGVILDAGAGTGLLSEMLIPLGYTEIVGIDLSAGMLDLARTKGLYKELKQMTLGQPLDFPDDYFASTVASGVFNVNHAPPDSFDELLRITKPGGYIVFSVRDDIFQESGFKEKQDSLELENRWKKVDMSDPVARWDLIAYSGNRNSSHRAFAYRVL